MLDGVTRTNRNACQSPDCSCGEKLISLLAELLFTGRFYSLTESARSLSCSKQSVLRLIDDRSLGYKVPISEELVGRHKCLRSLRLGCISMLARARTDRTCGGDKGAIYGIRISQRTALEPSHA